MQNAQSNGVVEIQENGRSGTVLYQEPAGVLSFYWEFGGGDTVATIAVGTEAEWQKKHAWAAPRRAEILQRVAAEVIRQRAPQSQASVDLVRGWILIHAPAPAGPSAPGSRVPLPPPRPAPFISKSKLMLILTIVILVLVLGAAGLKSLFSVRAPHGSPLGDSVRVGDEIVTMITTRESFVPTLHRDPGKDRYRLGLFVQPFDSTKPGRLIPIARELSGGAFQLSGILGFDGTNVWLRAHDIIAVNLRTGKVRTTADLARANPKLREAWDDGRRFGFNGRLHLTAPDYQSGYNIDPVSLVATPAPVERRTAASLPPKLADFLSVGVRPTPTEWIGAITPKEAAGYYKPGTWLRPFTRAEDAKDLRRLHRGALGPELEQGNREMLTLAPIQDTEFLNAAFLRSAPNAEPLRLTQPDGFVMIYTSVPGLKGTLKIARIDTAAKLVWDTDTGLDRFLLQQILPDSHTIVLVGTRLPIPDKVSEPLLVFVDTQSGAVFSVSLWRLVTTKHKA